MAFAKLPTVKTTDNVKMLVGVASVMLLNRVYDHRNQLKYYPPEHIFGTIVDALEAAQCAECLDYLDTYLPRGPLVKLRLPGKLGLERQSISVRTIAKHFADEYSYYSRDVVYFVSDFESHRSFIEDLWEGPVTITTMTDNPCGVTIQPAPRLPTLPTSIPLRSSTPDVIVLGTDILSGFTISEDVRRLPHLLIAGTSGFGKSVFLHQLIVQLIACSPDQVAQIDLVDLKGGVEFHAYRRVSNRVSVVWDIDEIGARVDGLIDLMQARQQEMVKNNWRLYPGRRVFFVVDEFAQIQLYPRQGKEEKAAHERLIGNLNRLSMLGRAVGIVLIVAVQKPTSDVMDSSFRMNLQGQVCFRVPNRLIAATMFGSVDDLVLDPVRLPPGRFIYFNATTGTTQYLQAHVAAAL